MADQTQGSITIDADPAAIMAVIADFDAYPEWSGSEMRSVEVVAKGPDGRASTVHFDVSAGPINVSYTLAYTYEPGDAGVSWSFVEGSGLRDLTGEYVLEPQGDGTLVTYRLRLDLAIPMLGFMKRQGEKRIIDTALKGLKARVESLAG